MVLAGVGPIVWLRLDSSRLASEQLAELAAIVPGGKIVALTDQPEDAEALALFAAGIRAYCNAHATAANLRQVAQVVASGGLWIGESLMGRLLAATRRIEPSSGQQAPSGAESRSGLTAREREVARLVADGASNKEIARWLAISERTVKAHVAACFGKLGARDRLHLALIVSGRAVPEPQPGSRQAA